MANIHPTAIVENSVKLADDVEIGPWCHLTGEIEIGAGTRLMHQVSLNGPLKIGENNLFYPGSAIGFAPQDFKFDLNDPGLGVVIGDNNTFREGVTIHRGTTQRATQVGNNNYMMVNAHMGHDSIIHNHVTLINGSLLAGHVEIFDHAIISGNCGIHQFCRVGRYSMIGATSAMKRDMPPFCTCYATRRVQSLNLVGLRRAGLRKHVKPLNRAFDIYFKNRHTSPVALEKIEAEVGDDPLVQEFCTFIKESTRGIVKYDAQT